MTIILYANTKFDQFIQFCKNHPEVLECHRLGGQYNFMVKLITGSVQTLESFIDESMKYVQPSTLIRLSSPVKNKSINQLECREGGFFYQRDASHVAKNQNTQNREKKEEAKHSLLLLKYHISNFIRHRNANSGTVLPSQKPTYFYSI
jgi:DNA-binding Lrp family transcriptional regulator